jgi:hypothetical protein
MNISKIALNTISLFEFIVMIDMFRFKKVKNHAYLYNFFSFWYMNKYIWKTS